MLKIVERTRRGGRLLRANPRLIALVTLIVLQAASVSFFEGDVIADVVAVGFDAHTSYEAFAMGALVLGVILGAAEMRRTISRGSRAESALKLAKKAFSTMIEDRFSTWALTKAEAEVALLTLKGFDTSEIGGLRNTQNGTVRAQLASIYSKSGWHNRGQFVSSFIDDLLESRVHSKAQVERT